MKKQTMDQHEETADNLAAIRLLMMRTFIRVSNESGKSKPGVEKLRRSLNHLDDAISKLEDQMFADYPDDERAHTGVYYRRECKVTVEAYDLSKNPRETVTRVEDSTSR